jgi:Protein of unknown function (DUF4446)
VTVVSILLALVALAVAVLALRRADVVERRARQWSETGPDPAEVSDSSARPAAAPLPRPVPSAGGALNRVGVVRYDAFDEVGGRMSFSAALLDDVGRGVVLTAIHGRAETRSYLKQVPVTADSGQRDLSPEESQAVAEAMKAAP